MTYKDYLKINNFMPNDHKCIFQNLVDMYSDDMSSIGIGHVKGENEPEHYDVVLDIMFMFERGYKNLNDNFNYIFENATNINAISSCMRQLSQMIHIKYFDSWKRIYLALVESEYNPIENYKKTEIITRDTTDTTHTESNSDITTTEDLSKNAFNSSSPKLQNSNQTNVNGSKDDNFSDVEYKQTGDITTQTNGNIGIMTNQSMINDELSLRQKQKFIEKVFNDVDEFILLQLA